MTRRRGKRAGAGFAIVEVVIAAAIVAGMMALTYRSIVTNAQAGRMVAARRTAAMVAQSVLAQATAAPGGAQPTQGRDGALTWRVDRSPYPGSGALPLERAAVLVRDDRGPVLTLQTVRVAR